MDGASGERFWWLRRARHVCAETEGLNEAGAGIKPLVVRRYREMQSEQKRLIGLKSIGYLFKEVLSEKKTIFL